MAAALPPGESAAASLTTTLLSQTLHQLRSHQPVARCPQLIPPALRCSPIQPGSPPRVPSSSSSPGSGPSRGPWPSTATSTWTAWTCWWCGAASCTSCGLAGGGTTAWRCWGCWRSRSSPGGRCWCTPPPSAATLSPRSWPTSPGVGGSTRRWRRGWWATSTTAWWWARWSTWPSVSASGAGSGYICPRAFK